MDSQTTTPTTTRCRNPPRRTNITNTTKTMKRAREATRYYAVRVGRTTGVFTTWEATSAAVGGYRGAQHKRFESNADAEAWLAGDAAPTATSEVGDHPPTSARLAKRPKPEAKAQAQAKAEEMPPSHHIDIYVDGNHFKGTRSMGYGICCTVAGRVYTFSDRVDGGGGVSREFAMTPTELASASNPTMELCAVSKALKFLARSSAERLPRSATIFSDFLGPKAWIEGTWRTRSSCIARIAEDARARLLMARSRGVIVSLEWVRGHSGHAENERADRLAKGGVEEGALSLEELLPPASAEG
jgi:ribonuclease HI